jgi:hypothetical protein
VDELYDWFVVTPFKLVANALYQLVDTLAIEGLAIRGTTLTAEGLGKLLRPGAERRRAALRRGHRRGRRAIVWALAG